MLLTRMKGFVRLVGSIVSCVLASSGFRVDTLGWSTPVTLALAAVGYGCHLRWLASSDPGRVYGYFLALFLIRYVYLFGSFVRGGIADRLIARLGEVTGYRVYEIGTAWMFFQRGLTFAPLIALHPWALLSPLGLDDQQTAIAKAACVGLGLLLVLIGFVVNTASTLVVGFDVYYYKDLFLRRALGKFEARGPYRYLSNPMYGVGQCSAYGAALMVGSVDGLLATLLNQLCMYGFYHLIEKPHIVAVFGSPGPDRGASAEPRTVDAMLKKGAIIGVLVALVLGSPSSAQARSADSEQRLLASYAAIGVGALAEGVARAEAGPASFDLGLGEARAGLSTARGVVAEIGYQYGSNVFLGLAAAGWSARVGVNPGRGAWRLGVGYGAPLLPLPSVVLRAAQAWYPRVERALVDETLLDAIAAALGPITDAAAAGSTRALGVGIQTGFEADGLGLYAFAGMASPI